MAFVHRSWPEKRARVELALRLYREGATYKEIGKSLGVTGGHACRLIKQETPRQALRLARIERETQLRDKRLTKRYKRCKRCGKGFYDLSRDLVKGRRYCDSCRRK